MRTVVSFYLNVPSFERGSVTAFSQVVAAHLPNWSSRMQLLKHEDDNSALEVQTSVDLLDAIQAKQPLIGGVGNLLLRGKYPGVEFYLSHSKAVLPVSSNVYTLAVETPSVEGHKVDEWIPRFFEAATDKLDVRYGAGCSEVEYEQKNMVNDSLGHRAVGLDYDSALPGLYWLNFFGSEYVNLMGKERLIAAPAHDVRQVGDGVLLQLHPRMEDWNTKEGLQRERAVEQHIGSQYFFSKDDPFRKTVAPDFWKK